VYFFKKHNIPQLIVCYYIKKSTKKRLTPKEQPPKKNKKGLASVILAPIRLKFELVIYILTEVDNFVKKNTKFF